MALTTPVVTASDLRGVELLDTSDVAARLELSASRVAQLEREGRIAAVRTVSGRRVFLSQDVEAFRRSRVTDAQRTCDAD
jgi:predicted site-specific integrase-resolvase